MSYSMEVVLLCAVVTAIGIFMMPLPLRCERRWCFRQQVGRSVYCRKHTDETLRGAP